MSIKKIIKEATKLMSMQAKIKGITIKTENVN